MQPKVRIPASQDVKELLRLALGGPLPHSRHHRGGRKRRSHSLVQPQSTNNQYQKKTKVCTPALQEWEEWPSTEGVFCVCHPVGTSEQSWSGWAHDSHAAVALPSHQAGETRLCRSGAVGMGRPSCPLIHALYSGGGANGELEGVGVWDSGPSDHSKGRG